MNIPEANFYLKGTKSKGPTLIYLQAKYSINNFPQRVMLSIGDKILPSDWNTIKKRAIVNRKNLFNGDIPR